MDDISDNLMKALVYEGPRTMNIRRIEIPSIQEDEVLIRVERAGICGSELSGYLGHNSLRKPPLVMGHEFAGRIQSAGLRVTGFQAGDRVTVNPLVSCGRCRDCLTGSANLCADRILIGAGRPGAYAEYVAVPAKNVHQLPDHLSFEQGALVEPFACALHISRLGVITPLDRLLVVGAGTIGLLVLQSAKAFGLTDVAVMDINRDRLEIVRELGGIPVSNVEELQQWTPERGFDIAVDAVGMDATRQQCVNTARPGGRVIFSGLHAAESVLPINIAVRNELSCKGAFAYNPEDFDVALQWIAGGKVNLDPWITYAGLEEGKACFEKLLTNPGKTAKIMLTV